MSATGGADEQDLQRVLEGLTIFLIGYGLYLLIRWTG